MCISEPAFQLLAPSMSTLLAFYLSKSWFGSILSFKKPDLGPLLLLLIKLTQYKKLAPNALRFTYWNLKSGKPHEKQIKNLLVKNWKLRVWCSLYHFFMWFARYQTLKGMWTAKYLAQASCTELTLLELQSKYPVLH